MLPGVLAGAIMSWITLISELSSSIILYTSKTSTLTVAIYTEVIRSNFGNAAAYSTVLTLTSIISLLIFFKLTHNKDISVWQLYKTVRWLDWLWNKCWLRFPFAAETGAFFIVWMWRRSISFSKYLLIALIRRFVYSILIYRIIAMVMWPVLPARLEGVYLHEKQNVLRGGTSVVIL